MKNWLLATIVCALALTPIMISAQDGPESVLPPSKQFRRTVIASGLAGPWEVTWGPDNMLWITERLAKRVTRIDPSNGKQSVAITINEISAPGGQEGLLGMALHPDLLKGKGTDYVYVAYTYVDQAKGAHASITDPANPYRYLYNKIVRLTYDASSGKLTQPVNVITGLPAGNDHNGGRLKMGPDRKLYLTIGDQGHNQFTNFCLPIESQRLPTQAEVNGRNFEAYTGKSLRVNLDGSVPADNPKLNGVVSHVFTYGHRNPQGLDFGPDGTLYSTEHGPKTDDEVNILKSGANYGWPHVAGFKDDKAYVYARWSAATTSCSQLQYNDFGVFPASVPKQEESAYRESIVEPIATMFTVPTGYNFRDPACKGVDFVCWPTVGVSSVEYYESKGKGIPGWDKVLLVSTLKRGSLYVLPLRADGKAAAGHFSRYFKAENRFRDTAVSPDGRTIYVATDPDGMAESRNGTTSTMQDPGAILAFTYTGEGAPAAEEAPAVSSVSPASKSVSGKIADAIPPRFTAAQASAGKTAYTANCAVCHGSTLTNGAYGTPLAGDYFKTKWSGKSLRDFYDKAQKTMPPSHPGSLPARTYSEIVAYILETNGFKAGDAPLVADAEEFDKMVLQ